MFQAAGRGNASPFLQSPSFRIKREEVTHMLLIGSSCHQPSRTSGQLLTPNHRPPDPPAVLVTDGSAVVKCGPGGERRGKKGKSQGELSQAPDTLVLELRLQGLSCFSLPFKTTNHHPFPIGKPRALRVLKRVMCQWGKNAPTQQTWHHQSLTLGSMIG